MTKILGWDIPTKISYEPNSTEQVSPASGNINLAAPLKPKQLIVAGLLILLIGVVAKKTKLI